MKDERAAEGLDHLQSAALELIQAARAFLDVAEDLVSDADKVSEVMSAIGSITDVATRAARARGNHESDRGDRPGGNQTPGGDHVKDGVQPIRVTS